MRAAPSRSISTPPTSDSGMLGMLATAFSRPICDWLKPRCGVSRSATGAIDVVGVVVAGDRRARPAPAPASASAALRRRRLVSRMPAPAQESARPGARARPARRAMSTRSKAARSAARSRPRRPAPWPLTAQHIMLRTAAWQILSPPISGRRPAGCRRPWAPAPDRARGSSGRWSAGSARRSRR